MAVLYVRAAALAGASLLAFQLPVSAQQADSALPDIVVTATRNPQAIARTGSAVTIIGPEEIAATGSSQVVDLLRAVPGLDTYESGGAGGVSVVSLRGATPGRTLILIDGVRINDPTAPSGEFDFGVMSVTDLERIEVLRGPQSALYGSDAMGGVVNIITKKGAGKPRVSVSLEGGSYGTLNSRTSVSGGTETLSYAFSLSGFRTNGFSRYGYRIGRIAAERALLGLPVGLEADEASKAASTGRISWRPVGGFELELGFAGYGSFVRFDNPGAYYTDPDDSLNKSRNRFGQIYAKAKLDSFGGQLRNTVTAYANRSTHYSVLTQSCYDSDYNSYDCRTNYRGERFGLEYQGDLKLGRLGLLSFGLRSERETANTDEQYLPLPMPKQTLIDVGQTTHSLWLQHQATIGERLDVSVSGRVDSIMGGKTFVTGRATAAYRFEETGTKLRASLGSGAKAPTLYQRYSVYGDPNLLPEKNVGVDAGLDQTFANGRATLSLTAFRTRYADLVDYNFRTSKYYNIGHAEMQGVEMAGDVVLVPEAWRLRASYTYLHAKNTDKDTFLLRRPFNKGYVSLVWSGWKNLELEGRLSMVGERFDIDNVTGETVTMPAYARLDLRANYRINENFSVFGRIENVSNARYEEIRDYGVSGRAFFAGVRATW